jgi:hypothetical protein
MNRRTCPVILVFLALVACGPELPPVQCVADGLEVSGEFALDCEKVARNVALARGLLEGLGVHPELDGLAVVVRDTKSLARTAAGGARTGYFSRSPLPGESYVEVTADGRALLHEMLHASEGHNPTHAGWAERGWYAATARFGQEFLPLDGSARFPWEHPAPH